MDNQSNVKPSDETNNKLSIKSKLSSTLKIDTYMLPCKASYFFSLSKDGSILPYMIPFLIGTGLSPSEAGLISGARFVGMILGAPFWGYVADKRQCHRIIVLILVAASFLLFGGQPLVSLAVGDKETNVCRSINQPANNTVLQSEEVGKNYVSTRFFVMLIMNLFAAFFDGSIVSLVDSGVSLKISKANGKKHFGWNRLFGTIGFAFGSFFAGLISEHFPNININCFTGAYCLFGLELIFLGLSLWFLYPKVTTKTLDQESANKENKSITIMSVLCCTLKNVDVIMFFFTVFFLGLLNSVHSSFSSVRLQELNASKSLIGLSISVGALACIPLFMFSSKMISFFRGTWGTLTVVCFTFVVRFTIFAYMKNPWISLPVNLLNAFGAGLVIVAMVSYVQSISPPQIYTIILAIMNSIYYGVAALTANVGGGFILNSYSGHNLFLLAGVVAAIWFAVLVGFTFVRVTKGKQKNENNIVM